MYVCCGVMAVEEKAKYLLCCMPFCGPEWRTPISIFFFFSSLLFYAPFLFFLTPRPFTILWGDVVFVLLFGPIPVCDVLQLAIADYSFTDGDVVVVHLPVTATCGVADSGILPFFYYLLCVHSNALYLLYHCGNTRILPSTTGFIVIVYCYYLFFYCVNGHAMCIYNSTMANVPVTYIYLYCMWMSWRDWWRYSFDDIVFGLYIIYCVLCIDICRPTFLLFPLCGIGRYWQAVRYDLISNVHWAGTFFFYLFSLSLYRL